MTPTPDTADLGGFVAALVATTIISLVIAAGVYVWTGLAMSRLFARLSIEPWRGWVPLLNVAEVLALGGSPKWVALLFLVPFANIYALVMFAIAAHRVNALFGRGAGMTVLAVLVLPAWASVLAWGKNTPDPERGRLAEVLGRQTQPTGPLAVPPQPVAPRTETPAGERAFPPLPGLEHHVPVRPGAQRNVPSAAPSGAQPSAPSAPAEPPATERPGTFVPPPPSPITPPPGVSAGWPSSPPAGPAVTPASPADAPAGSPVQAPAAQAAPVSPATDASSGRVSPPAGSPMQPPAGMPAHPVTGQLPPPQGAPIADRPPLADPVSASSGAGPAAPQRVDLGAPVAPWAPPAERTEVPDATVRDAAAAGEASLLPVPPANASFAPVPPAPPAASMLDSDEHGLDFADAATIVAYADEDQGDVESTVIVDRRPRRTWRLELDDGEVLPLSGEVVVLGRNPAAADGEQRLPVPDRTRTLSKTHARLAYSAGAWTITDLGSTNGVLIFDAAGGEVLIDPNVATPVDGRFVLGEVGMRVTEGDA